MIKKYLVFLPVRIKSCIIDRERDFA